MNDDDLTEVLEDAGLSPYQADAYVTVLKLGASSATDIAESSAVPDPRIYDVLRDLEKKGYIETYQQGSLYARAHDPSQVLEDLRSRSTRFADAAGEIEERWEQPAMEDHEVSIVKRFETVLNRADSLIRDADNQVQICVTPDEFEKLRPALAEAHGRGVNIKLSLNTTDESGSFPAHEELVDACTEARHRKLPSPFVALIDRSWTCFAPNTHSVNQYGVLVNDRTHTYVFHWYFQTCLWEVWEMVYSTRSQPPPVTYVDLRQCVRDIEPLLEEGARVYATVEGYEVETGQERTITGVITDTSYVGSSPTTGEEPPLSQLAGQIHITVDTGTEEVVVGGWGAVLEQMEATCITVEEIEER